MSTQKSRFPAIAFTVAQSLQNVRLLEVPEELLDIIVNTQQSLYLKSAAPSHTGNGVEGKEGHVHLCTESKVWAVKQVSTSNSIYVTRTGKSEPTSHDEEGGAIDGNMEVDKPEGDKEPSLGISAIAKPTSILELHALPPATYETTVHDHLSSLVPTISSPEDILVGVSSQTYRLDELYSHIPAPTSAIQRVLAQKCAFEIPRLAPQSSDRNPPERQTYIPTPSLLLSTWAEIVNNAVLTDTDITDIESINALLKANNNPEVLNDTDDNTADDRYAKFIHRAISTRLFDSKHGHLATLGILTNKSQDTKQKPTLNIRECTRWVGNLILAVAASQETHAASTLTKSTFEKQWEDTVPAHWIKYCSIEVLQSSCEVTAIDGQEIVKWMPFTLENNSTDNGGGTKEISRSQTVSAGTGTATAKATKNKRKWHEKFAAQRDAKR